MTPESVIGAFQTDPAAGDRITPVFGAGDTEQHRSLAEAVSADQLVPRLVALTLNAVGGLTTRQIAEAAVRSGDGRARGRGSGMTCASTSPTPRSRGLTAPSRWASSKVHKPV